MDPIIIRENGVTATIPIKRFPTANPHLNNAAADQLLERFSRATKNNVSVGKLEEFAEIFKQKFPHRLDDYDKVIHQTLEAL